MKKMLLMILDGWGIGDKTKSDVIYNANTPFTKELLSTVANSTLKCTGEDVGLPDGQMGNSEVGHLNIGAGRVVYQDYVKINKAIEDNTISQNKTIIDAYNYAKENDKAVHFIGLVSDGGVHSNTKHLMKLCDIAKDYNLEKVYIHALTDGRDTDPRSGKGYLQELEDHLSNSTGEIASLCGRYYTMDRDKRWERVKEGYDLLVHGKGEPFNNVIDAIESSYDNDITDEFVKPVIITNENNKPIATVKEDDVFICFNFRTDRLREITTVLTQQDFPDLEMKRMPLHYLTMTRYDESFKDINIIFVKDDVTETLGEVVSKSGKKQIRIAETEKYAHVTFFLSGGRENEFEGEKRILIPSPKIATYDLKPPMSAIEVTEAILPELNNQSSDLICLNFANADMVGHTGIYDAIIEAVETVDKCVKEVVETARKNDYSVMIIADHGNADYAQNPDNSPNTAHSHNQVPCILLDDDYKSISDGKLADVAPTILSIMELPIPDKMTGNILIDKIK